MNATAMKKQIIDLISRRLQVPTDRFLLGICGAPGSGKSTLADWIINKWNRLHERQAVLLPMDGYHLSNEELVQKGLLPLKGIPETFAAASFLQKLAELRQFPEKTHFCPRFDRSLEASIEDAIEITPGHRLVVVEGNYLLLDTEPWRRVKDILDEIWFIEAEEELIFPRLVARHMKGGKNKKAAFAKVNSTDLPNARLVANGRSRATQVFKAADLYLSGSRSSSSGHAGREQTENEQQHP
jgi:pantothenate kinase